jgi:hypothetical protein
VLLVGPLAHISANLCEDGLRDRITDTVDGDEVDTRNTEDMRTGVDRGSVLTVRVGFATWWRGRPYGHGRCGRGLEAWFDNCKAL